MHLPSSSKVRVIKVNMKQFEFLKISLSFSKECTNIKQHYPKSIFLLNKILQTLATTLVLKNKIKLLYLLL